MKHPKPVYRYVMILLILSFGLSFLEYFYFTPDVKGGFKTPSLYSKSDQIKAKAHNREKETERIVKELQQMKGRRENGPLTKNDSLRIEYLFNQYQTLKNGH